jgi:hypothetical protein
MTDDGAEELSKPQRRSAISRLRKELALGAAVLFVILLVTRQHGNDGAAGPSPSPSLAPTPPRTTSTSPAPQSLDTGTLAVYPVPNQHVGNFERCPQELPCEHFADVTLGIRAALHDAFPGVHVLRARTTRIDVKGYGTALWSSTVRARADADLIRLRVRPRSPADRQVTDSARSGGHEITHWESVQNQLRVVIDVVGPAGPAPLTAIEQLARDARLVSPW